MENEIQPSIDERLQKSLDKALYADGRPEAQKLRNFLNGTWLGEPLHVVLTDVPVGAWTAAMAFDPICGDGTAHAIREAILASAVIRALTDGGSTDHLLSHYEARLTAGFQRHLMLCRQFYLRGGTGALWRSELDAIDRGIQWADATLAKHVSFRYQLRGFELEAVR